MTDAHLWMNPELADPSTIGAIHPQIHQPPVNIGISATTSGGGVNSQDSQHLLLPPTMNLNQRPMKRGLSTNAAARAGE
ncbi:hypothetical protein [Corynebacterium xerosis]|uniref:hypothetical protein n=1 Tax=Corynebacterium xerosis TaxID=1725 RepID=UPI0013CECF36|nr:hypothetical protein [Corynebacterium xerosis]